jgi:hypothetical protein
MSDEEDHHNYQAGENVAPDPEEVDQEDEGMDEEPPKKTTPSRREEEEEEEEEEDDDEEEDEEEEANGRKGKKRAKVCYFKLSMLLLCSYLVPFSIVTNAMLSLVSSISKPRSVKKKRKRRRRRNTEPVCLRFLISLFFF